MEVLTNFCNKAYSYSYNKLWVPSIKWGQERGYLPPAEDDWRQYYPEKYVKVVDQSLGLVSWGGTRFYALSIWLFTYLMMLFTHTQMAYERWERTRRSCDNLETEEVRPKVHIKSIWKADVRDLVTVLYDEGPVELTDKLYQLRDPDALYYIYFAIQKNTSEREGILICESIGSHTPELLEIDTANKLLSAELDSDGINADVTEALNLYVTVPANKEQNITLKQIRYSETSLVMEETGDILKVIHPDAQMGEYTNCCHIKRLYGLRN